MKPRVVLNRFLLGLALAVSFPFALAAQERKIVVGLTTRTGTNSLPFVIAEEKGFFKGEGLNAVVVIMQNQVVVISGAAGAIGATLSAAVSESAPTVVSTTSLSAKLPHAAYSTTPEICATTPSEGVESVISVASAISTPL